MSKAFKCDICGEFYEENNEFHKYYIIDSISEFLEFSSLTNLNLCDSCRNKIKSIIENENNTQK